MPLCEETWVSGMVVACRTYHRGLCRSAYLVISPVSLLQSVKHYIHLYSSIYYLHLCTIYIYMHIHTIYLLLCHDFYTIYLFYGCRPCFGVFEATLFSPPGWRQLKTQAMPPREKSGSSPSHGVFSTWNPHSRAGPGWDWVINLFPRKM